MLHKISLHLLSKSGFLGFFLDGFLHNNNIVDFGGNGIGIIRLISYK